MNHGWFQNGTQKASNSYFVAIVDVFAEKQLSAIPVDG